MFNREKSDAIFTDTMNFLEFVKSRCIYADYMVLHNKITALYDSFSEVEDLRQLAKAQAGCGDCRHKGKYENEREYGYPSPCTGCKRVCVDQYEAAEKALEGSK